MSLAPGMRSILSEYETSIKTHAAKASWITADGDSGTVDQTDHDELEALSTYMERKKQALLRKLLRQQNGDEVVDVEELKKILRRMARTIYNLKLHGSKNVMDILDASPEVLADVERIISKRRTW